MTQEKVKPNFKEIHNQEAQLAAENIESGKEEVPTVDFDADYEAAQKMSRSDSDQASDR